MSYVDLVSQPKNLSSVIDCLSTKYYNGIIQPAKDIVHGLSFLGGKVSVMQEIDNEAVVFRFFLRQSDVMPAGVFSFSDAIEDVVVNSLGRFNAECEPLMFCECGIDGEDVKELKRTVTKGVGKILSLIKDAEGFLVENWPEIRKLRPDLSEEYMESDVRKRMCELIEYCTSALRFRCDIERDLGRFTAKTRC